MNQPSWFVCPRPVPNAEIRLFLFPHAGGGPAVFSKWPADFPDNVEIWMARYPGRGSQHDESPIKELNALAGKLSQDIQPLLDKSYALFGHSMGGWVAFEMTRRLRKKDLAQPTTLIVSACSAPHLPDPHPPIYRLPDPEFLDALHALNGIPAELMNLPEVLELFLPALRADFEAVDTYVYSPNGSLLDLPIVAFGGLDDTHVSRESIEGWVSYTDASFKSQYFPGDHFFINSAREAVIASIASELTAAHAKD